MIHTAASSTDEVQVVRKLPGEIDIHVVERKPVAWITSEKEISDPFASDGAFLWTRVVF